MQSTILLDPNWHETGGSRRGAQNHYEIAKTHTMPRTILTSPEWDPAPDCHVYMWVTKKYLANGEALKLMWALGVRPVTHFVWLKTPKPKGGKKGAALDAARRRRARKIRFRTGNIKLRGGIGQYGRGSHEILLMGVMIGGKGTVYRSDRKDIQDVFFAPVGRHSAKPVEGYELIEARTLCPEGTTRLEMYARSAREGWTAWGHEAPPAVTPTEPEEQPRKPTEEIW